MISAGRKSGFSMAEVLIAIGILSVALIFIAGVFPVGINFTQKNIDDTTAAIVAKEGFSKTRLLAEQILSKLPNDVYPFVDELQYDIQRLDWLTALNKEIEPEEDRYTWDDNFYLYPSDETIDPDKKQYCWNGMYRLLRPNSDIDPNIPPSFRDVQVTIFIYRLGSTNDQYLVANTDANDFGDVSYGQARTDISRDLPGPIKVEFLRVTGVDNELQIRNAGEKFLINDGDQLICDRTGRVYRVLERYPGDDDDIILLDRDFDYVDFLGEDFPANDLFIWVLPSRIVLGSVPADMQVTGKNPCVAIYQEVLRF
jgi:prepilin-type N-terminal cleavage/methylation domain-containing protein